MEKTKKLLMDPLSNYGFKYLFGSINHKDVIIDFLNAFFDSLDSEMELYKHTILDIRYKAGTTGDRFWDINRKPYVVFLCSCSDGSVLKLRLNKIVLLESIRSLHNVRTQVDSVMSYFVDAHSYPKCYDLTLLNYRHSDNESRLRCACLVTDGKMEQTRDNLVQFQAELSLFPDGITSDSTRFDKWIYLLRNLSTMTKIPECLDDDIFQRVFEIMDCGNLSTEVFHDYVRHLDEERNILESVMNQLAEERSEEAGN